MFLDVCRAGLILSALLFAFGEVMGLSVVSRVGCSLAVLSMVVLLVARFLQ